MSKRARYAFIFRFSSCAIILLILSHFYFGSIRSNGALIEAMRRGPISKEIHLSGEKSTVVWAPFSDNDWEPKLDFTLLSVRGVGGTGGGTISLGAKTSLGYDRISCGTLFDKRMFTVNELSRKDRIYLCLISNLDFKDIQILLEAKGIDSSVDLVVYLEDFYGADYFPVFARNLIFHFMYLFALIGVLFIPIFFGKSRKKTDLLLGFFLGSFFIFLLLYCLFFGWAWV